jgi:hypothetical protein
MPPQADIVAYAQALAARLDPSGSDADLAALKAAATGLQLALNDPVANPWNLALQAWHDATLKVKNKVLDYVKSLVPLPGVDLLLKDFSFDRPEGLDLKTKLGPLGLELEAPTLVVTPPGPATLVEVLGPELPRRVAAILDAGPIQGGGSLEVLPDGLRGALEARLGTFSVAALGSLRQTGGPNAIASFLAVLGVRFVPGIQVGFGFALSSVGGLIGVNRTTSIDALASRIRSGTAGDVLFPRNPVADAGRLLPAMDEIFPPRAGNHLVGPTFELSWLDVDGEPFVSLDLGVIIELPGPSKIIVAGSARAAVPGPVPLLRLRLDFAGGIDFGQGLGFFDASLIDSRAAIVFVIGGDAAFRLSTGHRPYVLLSLGGFYPGFNPEPAVLPPLRRLSLSLDSPVPIPGFSMRAEAYVAVTSNTVQFGALFEASMDAIALSAVGSFSLDALIQFTPFHFHANFSASFHVETLGFSWGGVRFDGTIDGPGPVSLEGRLTIETFLKDISWHHTFVLPPSSSQPAPPAVSLLDALAPELDRPENLAALGGPDPVVSLHPMAAAGPLALLPPLGQLRWTQKRSPLDIPVDRCDGVRLGTTQGASAVSTDKKADVFDAFSPGTYIELKGAEDLNKPAFDELHAGMVLGWSDKSGPAQNVPQGYRKIRKVGGEVLRFALDDSLIRLTVSAAALGLLADRQLPARPATTTPLVGLVRETWQTTGGTVHDSATAAHQQARRDQSLALPALDLSRPVDLSGV